MLSRFLPVGATLRRHPSGTGTPACTPTFLSNRPSIFASATLQRRFLWRRPGMLNQTLPEQENNILEMAEPFPTASNVLISQQLRLIGVRVSPSAVR